MVEHRIAQTESRSCGIVVGKADRLIGAVGAGKHQRVGDAPAGTGHGRQQQVMEG